MLNFIDISSHQGDIDLSVLPIDAVIIKATEATSLVYLGAFIISRKTAHQKPKQITLSKIAKDILVRVFPFWTGR